MEGKVVSLNDPPTDGVSSVKYCSFSTSPSLLLATSWDSFVRVYDTATNTTKASYEHKAPVLDGAFVSSTAVASAGLDTHVRILNMETGISTSLGMHDEPVRCVDYSSEYSTLLTSSWDKTLRSWDPRSADSGPTSKTALPDRAYSMSLCGPHMVIVGTAERHVVVHDLRKLGGRVAAAGGGGGGGVGSAAAAPPPTLLYSRETGLAHQTRVLRAFNDASGYIAGSIDGRGSVEWLDVAEHASKKFSFKCHRFKLPNSAEERIFPVNTISFHPVFGTFVTGGGDGTVVSWDYKSKKRLATIRDASSTSIASTSFSRDGTQLAVAVSYTWEQGERDHPPDAIFIHPISDSQVYKV